MKKKVSILLSCILLLGALTACGTAKIPVAVAPDVDYPPKFPEMEGITPLTEAQITEIEQAFREEYGYDMKWFNWDNPVTRHFGYVYLGTMDGYTLLFSLRGGCGDPVGKNGTVWIDFLRFSSNYLAATCYGYKDGEWFSTYELDLNHVKARAIYQRYCAFEELLYARDDLIACDLNSLDGLPPLEECPYSEEDLLAAGLPDWVLSTGTYLGTYHGCIAFYARSDWDDLRVVYLFRNGKVMKLEDAFNNWYLTVEEYFTLIRMPNAVMQKEFELYSE